MAEVPNFLALAQAGFEAGREQARQRRLEGALSGVDLKRPETIMPILRDDPQHGIALLGAADKLATTEREAAGRVALTGYLLDRHAPKGGGLVSVPAQGSSPLPSDPAAAPVASTSEDDLIRADPHAWLSVQGNLAQLNDDHRKAIGEAAEAQGTIALAAGRLPYAQRKAYIQSQLPYLETHGVTADMIAGFDPTDANIQAQADQALGVKGILAQQNVLRDDARADRNTESAIATRNASSARSDAARGEAHVRFVERNSHRGGKGGGKSGAYTNDTLDALLK